ncbi:uncharacterized protein LOC109608427 [Aethina tumida]|uniref:uncharacterized protein LOC109608427 n=1 Tax=Aethina tumida TaxID=116153 RepID=UPI002147D8E0|nr:uncharacterized protein LOC109608427 [Aethina tumida]
MNKQKSFDHKKKLVRNTAEKVSNAIVQDQHSAKKIHTETKQIESKSEKTTDEKLFELPRLYSSLRLSKKIDEVNSQKPKSTVDSKKDLAIDEKVSRKVNFSHDQAIYKDLIQLNSPVLQNQPNTIKKVPSIQKDREPNLSNFINDYTVQERFYKPELTAINRTLTNTNNSLRLYNVLQIHNETVL